MHAPEIQIPAASFPQEKILGSGTPGTSSPKIFSWGPASPQRYSLKILFWGPESLQHYSLQDVLLGYGIPATSCPQDGLVGSSILAASFPQDVLLGLGIPAASSPQDVLLGRASLQHYSPKIFSSGGFTPPIQLFLQLLSPLPENSWWWPRTGSSLLLYKTSVEIILGDFCSIVARRTSLEQGSRPLRSRGEKCY